MPRTVWHVLLVAVIVGWWLTEPWDTALAATVSCLLSFLAGMVDGEWENGP